MERSFDYSKLKGKIVEEYGSQKRFCQENGLKEPTFSRKMMNKSYFTQEEISMICTSLHIQVGSIGDYFFNEKV